MTVRVDDLELAAWCRRHLGSAPAVTLFAIGHLSAVRLEDGRSVVVKVRPGVQRLTACAAVQRHLFEAGFPCPQPLAGPWPSGEAGAVARQVTFGREEIEAKKASIDNVESLSRAEAVERMRRSGV